MASYLTEVRCNAQFQWEVLDTNDVSPTYNKGSVLTPTVSIAQSETGDRAGNKLYRAAWSLAASATTDYDLAGSLTDFFGTTITLARVKGILLFHDEDSDATDGVEFGKSTLSAAGEAVSWTSPMIAPSGWFGFVLPDATGIAITAATADKFRLRNLDASETATGQIVIIGSST
jgi:opacity protein-like surface antigen